MLFRINHGKGRTFRINEAKCFFGEHGFNYDVEVEVVDGDDSKWLPYCVATKQELLANFRRLVNTTGSAFDDSIKFSSDLFRIYDTARSKMA